MFEAIYLLVTKMGFMIIPLFLVGWFGWYYVIELGLFFFREQAFITHIKKTSNPHFLATKKTSKQANIKPNYPAKSLFKTYLHLIEHYKHLRPEELEARIEWKLGARLADVKQKLISIKVFVAVAPLLGLLGTVNGMIVTFKVISYYGNSSPILLSDGISEALLTTQGGLVIAFPLLFFQVILNNRSKTLNNLMELELSKLKNHP